MEFPILDLLADEHSPAWLLQHLHPNGLTCPHGQASHHAVRFFRIHRGSGLPVWRWQRCQGIYNLDRGTVFAASHLAPGHGVLLLRGVLQGHPSAHRAREIGLTEKPVLKWRHRLHAQAAPLQPNTALPDRATESDEMFQNAGDKK
jgi:hypothetical protein